MPHTSRVHKAASTRVPTVFGECQMIGYLDTADKTEHVALCFGDIQPDRPTLIRIHSECITGEAFGSLKCECGPQLQAAMQQCAEESGIVLYLRGQEGRGIGLLNKLRAYSLQEDGLNTVEANEALGLPAEAREYGAAIGILQDLGITTVRLLSNNPSKVQELKDSGIAVTEIVPIVVGVNNHNRGYLQTKVEQMGHSIDKESLSS